MRAAIWKAEHVHKLLTNCEDPQGQGQVERKKIKSKAGEKKTLKQECRVAIFYSVKRQSPRWLVAACAPPLTQGQPLWRKEKNSERCRAVSDEGVKKGRKF